MHRTRWAPTVPSPFPLFLPLPYPYPYPSYSPYPSCSCSPSPYPYPSTLTPNPQDALGELHQLGTHGYARDALKAAAWATKAAEQGFAP